MKIRYAGDADFDFVLSGRKEIARAEGFRIPDLAREKKRVNEAISGKRVRVAVEDGKAAGFLWFAVSEETPFGIDYGEFGMKYCWVDYVFTAPGKRGRGVGTALYEDVTEIARKKGAKKIMCDVFTVNKASAAFHSRIGFKPLLGIYWRDCR
ncbi:Acetyltransferase (GNAT) family protein [uncultured archaeon]|nr:Acetyltransferase (GNAT) family protein [uncultured archaeon]